MLITVSSTSLDAEARCELETKWSFKFLGQSVLRQRNTSRNPKRELYTTNVAFENLSAEFLSSALCFESLHSRVAAHQKKSGKVSKMLHFSYPPILVMIRVSTSSHYSGRYGGFVLLKYHHCKGSDWFVNFPHSRNYLPTSIDKNLAWVHTYSWQLFGRTFIWPIPIWIQN